MGVYDVPAIVIFILGKTGFDQISYVGHSEGTTQIMAGASLIPDFYNQKFKIAFFLAPPAAMKNNDVPLLKMINTKKTRKALLDLMNTIGLWNIIPKEASSTIVSYFFCKDNLDLCNNWLAGFADTDVDVDNMDKAPVYISNLPSGASFFNFDHYAQLMDHEHEKFCRYDYGSPELNM